MPSEAQHKAKILADLGDRGTNSIFELVFPVDATAGTWRLSFGGAQSAAIARFAQPGAVQTALQTIPTIGANNALVLLGQHGFRVELLGALKSQAQPLPETDGSDLVAAGEIAVMEKQQGRAPYFSGDAVDTWWAATAPAGSLDYRFLLARRTAMQQYLALLSGQIDTTTGDVKRNYSQQFKQAETMYGIYEGDLQLYQSRYVTNVSPLAQAHAQAQATVLSHPQTTPNGKPYGCF